MSTKFLFDQKEAITKLEQFFQGSKTDINDFGRTVNQTVEVFAFTSTAKYYKECGWNLNLIHPNKKNKLKFKFSTRGKQSNYSFFKITKGNEECQIRHNLRVENYFNTNNSYAGLDSNFCVDIAITQNYDFDKLSSDTPIPNQYLISFGEVKHMSAFPELLASFIGLVHELKPECLKRINNFPKQHLYPFLYLSGKLLKSGNVLFRSFKHRGYKLLIFDIESNFTVKGVKKLKKK